MTIPTGRQGERRAGRTGVKYDGNAIERIPPAGIVAVVDLRLERLRRESASGSARGSHRNRLAVPGGPGNGVGQTRRLPRELRGGVHGRDRQAMGKRQTHGEPVAVGGNRPGVSRPIRAEDPKQRVPVFALRGNRYAVCPVLRQIPQGDGIYASPGQLHGRSQPDTLAQGGRGESAAGRSGVFFGNRAVRIGRHDRSAGHLVLLQLLA